ncbi:MAG: type I restriction endonuclease subunit R, partial [Enterococcus faecalis]|nr:type I restriction endonuclease subunit R [Enterococcus faecalis]
VTASRLHAVRYMKEFKKYIANKGYNDLNVLVAFSGLVVDGETEYTETKMNVTKSGENVRENQLKEAFHTDNFNILIVAEKYQTGFDEPLLHTMFVDKKLKGVKAVQTLSRLNRTMPGKKDTFILDFVNDVEDIEAAFQPFYEQTNLREEINVNLIYDTQSKLRKFNVYNQGDIERVMKLVKQAQKQQNERLLGRISSMFKPIMDRYEEMNKDNQYQFRVTLRNFSKWYDYISQLDRLFDMELLEERIFTGYLLKFLPKETRENIDISDKVKLEYYKLRQDFSGEIHLVNKEGELVNPKTIDAGIKPPDERDSLEEIIHKINERFPNDFDEGDRVLVEILYRSFADNPDLKVVSMAKNNDAQMFEKSLFPDVFKDKVMEQYEKNNAAFEKMFGHDDRYFDLVYTLVASDLYKLLRTK